MSIKESHNAKGSIKNESGIMKDALKIIDKPDDENDSSTTSFESKMSTKSS